MARSGSSEPVEKKAEQQASQVSESGESQRPSSREIALAGEVKSAIQVRNGAAMQTFMEWCVARGQTTDEDQYDLMASIIGEIMTAQNMAELMEERAPLHGRDLVGKVLLLHGFEIREGSYEESPIGYYAAMTCSTPHSEHMRIVTCGAAKVLAKLMMIEHLISREDTEDDYPVLFWFTARVAKSGNTVLDIVTPPRDAL